MPKSKEEEELEMGQDNPNQEMKRLIKNVQVQKTMMGADAELDQKELIINDQKIKFDNRSF